MPERIHQPIRAITLDLDDTLWPILPTILRAEQIANQWFAHQAPDVLLRFDSAARLELRDLIAAEHPARAHDLSWLRHELFARMLAQSGHDAARAGEVFDLFFAARQEVRLYDEAAEALARLAARLPIAAVSNGNADLARIGIAHHFAFSLSARDYGAAKPDPGIYREACRRLGFAPEQVLHVGDDPHADVVGALRAGLPAAWVNRRDHAWPHAPEQPTLTVRDLAALADQLLVD
jgi:putative hydrolase of the HAD superfamily